MKNEFLHKFYGGMLVTIFLIMVFIECKKLVHPFANFELKAQYIDYTILIYLSSWFIDILLFLAGVSIGFKWKKASLLLWTFSLTSLLEICINETFYTIKSVEGFSMYGLLCTSIVSLILVCSNLLKTPKMGLNDITLSIILAIMIVYLPNALITFYF